MVPANPFGLDDTCSACWRRRLMGSGIRAKRHWRTKTTYYAALSELLRSGRTTNLTWLTIVTATRPHGNRSTFYEVTGPSAKHSLLKDLLAAQGVEALQVCLCYSGRGVVDQLIDETKVWAYWPHREALVARLRIAPDLDAAAATDLLVSSVTRWAGTTAHLAQALNYAPPLCAVEDMIAINAGRLSATNAYAMLTTVIRGVTDGPSVYDTAVA